MTDADRWEYCEAGDYPDASWIFIVGPGDSMRYRRLRYPRYAKLADIPITPGRVEWLGQGPWVVLQETTAGKNDVHAETVEYKQAATVGQVIHDFANALTTESDEAWLRKRGIATAKDDEIERGLLWGVVNALPRCMVWTRGSGGHCYFDVCPSGRLATHWDDADSPHYCCGEHLPEYDDYEELPWADELRALRERGAHD